MYNHINEDLRNINGIKFTKREVDIISCILSGKGVKAIAKLLNLSPRTVETHINNVKIKIGVSSKEHIIELAEFYGKTSLLHQHYDLLLERNDKKTWLKGNTASDFIEKFPLTSEKTNSSRLFRDEHMNSIFKKFVVFLNRAKYRLTLFKYSLLVIIGDIIYHAIDGIHSILQAFGLIRS